MREPQRWLYGIITLDICADNVNCLTAAEEDLYINFS